MNCSKCGNYINTPKECILCQEKFCSEECIIYHNQIYHQSNLDHSHIESSINNNSFLNYARESNSLQSPFLVTGIMNYDYIRYDPIYSPDNFTFVYSNGAPKSIGNGSFGQVYLAINNKDKKTYAIKHMEKDKLMKYLQCLDPIYAEIDIQSRVDHPNIIKLLYVRETETTFDLVMDYAKDGTLFEYVVKNKGLPEKQAFKYFIQIVNAIKFLHDNDVIHRDIKPENILLFENNVVKLCDFGWSIKCVDHLPGGSFTGTTEYMAPELIDNMDYGKEIDLWMLGILLYELMHGFSPFRPKKPTFEDNEVVYNIKNHKISFYMPVSDDCKKLIFSLLEIDKNKRCTIEGIYNSRFVKNYEREEYDINSSPIERDENEVSEKSRVSNSIAISNINNENPQDKNQMQITKSLLLDRYIDNEEISESKKITIQENNNDKNYQFFNNKRIESDNLTNSKISNNNDNYNEYYLLNNEENIKNSLDVDDPYGDEPNAPKNNRRNRIKNKKNIHNSITKLNFNFNNEAILSPLKNIEEDNKQNTITNSPKNNNKNRKKNNKNNLDLNLNPNTILNNNLSTSRRFREGKDKDIENKKLEISQDSNIRKRSVINFDNNRNKKVKSEITNYIFNNNKEINIKQKIFAKKLALNTNNQQLSLSLSPGTFEYNSLLTRSVSPGKQFVFPKDKTDIINQNYKSHFPVDVSDNLSNTSNNIRDYPFDHFASNSSLDIRKPIFKKNIESNEDKINENEEAKINCDEDEIFEVKEKEPNDNMRRKNKKADMPQDSCLKNSINYLNENLKPKDSTNKIGRYMKSIDNKKTENYFEKKTANSALNESINLNNLNPITKHIIKKIKEDKTNSKNTSIRNFSVNTADNIRTKRQNSDDFKKNLFVKNNNKTSKNVNTSLNQDILLGSNLKNIISPIFSKINKTNNKNLTLNKINGNKNMSFLAKSNNKILNNINDNTNKERRQKFLDNRKEKKGGSVNKQMRFKGPKLIKDKNEKKGIKQIRYLKSSKINNKYIKNKDNEEYSQNETSEYKDYSYNKENIEFKDIIFKDNKEKENNESKDDIIFNEKDKGKDNIETKEEKIFEDNEITNKQINDNKNIENNGKKENENTEISQDNETEKKHESKEEQISIIIKTELNNDNKEGSSSEKLELHDETHEGKDSKNTDNKSNIEEENNLSKKISNKSNEDNDISKEKENIEKKSNNSNDNKNDNNNNIIVKERSEISENNVYKEIIESKHSNINNKNNANEENVDNIQKKEIKQNKNTIQNQKIKIKKIVDNKNKKNGIRLKKRIVSNNQSNNRVESKQHVKKITGTKQHEQVIENKDIVQKNLSKENIIVKTIDIEKVEKEPKDKIRKIYKKGDRRCSKEKRYTKVKMDPSKEKNKLYKVSNNQKIKNKLPKKINTTKIKQNSEQLTNSSAYEYTVELSKEDNRMKNSYNVKTNGSNSESKTTSYSKNNINSIKEKIKCFSVINEDLNINFNKSKSPEARKKFVFKNKIEKKDEVLFTPDTNSDNIPQIKRISQIKNDENIDNIFHENKNDKNENKENIEINKEINNNNDEKNREKKEIMNINSIKNKNIIKKTKKKYRKDNLKEDKDQNEIHNNDSESYIIEGDSEYGDSEIF